MARAYLVQYRIALLPHEVGRFIAELSELNLTATVESEIDQVFVHRSQPRRICRVPLVESNDRLTLAARHHNGGVPVGPAANVNTTVLLVEFILQCDFRLARLDRWRILTLTRDRINNDAGLLEERIPLNEFHERLFRASDELLCRDRLLLPLNECGGTSTGGIRLPCDFNLLL
jgi:hypothetical protein